MVHSLWAARRTGFRGFHVHRSSPFPLTFRTLFSLYTVPNFPCFSFVAIFRPSIILNRPKDLSSICLRLAFLSFHSFRSKSSCFLDNDHTFYRCNVVALISRLNFRGFSFSHNAFGHIKTIYSMTFKTIRFSGQTYTS